LGGLQRWRLPNSQPKTSGIEKNAGLLTQLLIVLLRPASEQRALFLSQETGDQHVDATQSLFHK
jgi:hypothetical protein